MKKMINITLIATFMVLFTGCNDSNSDNGGGGGAAQHVPTFTEMELDLASTIKSGDSIVKTSENALIEIVVVDGVKTATLIEGNATIRHE